MSRCAARVMAILAIAAIPAVAASCNKGTATEPPGEPPPRTSSTAAGSAATAGPAVTGWTCEPLPFEQTTPVPEASGAAWLVIDGKLSLVIVSDSGNRGAYGVIDPETGATIETGTLPLSDEASDDIEGLAARGDRMYGLTSSGWIRVWRRQDRGFELVEKPYPLGPIDLPNVKHNDSPPEGDGMVCKGRGLNCGRNYEGLCLVDGRGAAPRGEPRDACVGFAASKADGHLYCLTETAGKLAVHRDRAIAITRPGALADCAYNDDNTMWAASNAFDLGNVYRVTHWEDPPNAQVERVAALPLGFPELVAVRGDVVYRMSDMGGSPSLMAKVRCHR